MTLVNVDTVFELCLHCARCVCVCVRARERKRERRHSGVEFRRMGLCVTWEGSGTAAVVTPIFLRLRSSVTEMERENAGRGTSPESETHRYIHFYMWQERS